MSDYLLSLITFVPTLALLILLGVPSKQHHVFRWSTLGVCLLQLALILFLYFSFDTQKAGVDDLATFQWVEQHHWIQLDLGSLGKLHIQYLLGVDGLNISLILLAGIVMLMGALASWKIKDKVKGYFLLYLLLYSSIIGCFVALDFFLFYLFFEFMLLPMYFLIGIWGGERRAYASIKFFLYTLVGSLFILIVMIGLYLSVVDPLETAHNLKIHPSKVVEMLQSGTIDPAQMTHSFSLIDMSNTSNIIKDSLVHHLGLWGMDMKSILFLMLFIGFAIKLPVVPLHTWLPDAHVEAPTPISVVLAGILLKVGGYGLLRIGLGVFPEEAKEMSHLLGGLGVLSIIYGAFNALAMQDLKRMVAYSSVSHMGFVLLGMASMTQEGVNGAIYQMFSHGILSAFLFLIVGVLYDRTHDRMIGHYSGLLGKMPVFGTFVIIAFFASLGLPAFSGFVGELFTILGGFASPHLPKWMAVMAASGIILGAAYFLWTLQKMFFGKFWVKSSSWDALLVDINTREMVMLLVLSLITFLTGILPALVFDLSAQSVIQLLN